MAGFGTPMVDHKGLFFGWGSPRAGREAAAGKVFAEGVAYWTAHKAAGDIESVEYVILEPHGGDLAGFILVRGDPEKLGRLRVDPEFERLMDRCAVCCDHVGVVVAVVDDQVMRALGLWGEEIGDLI